MAEGFLVKEDCESIYGKNPEERSVEEIINFGYVVVDKPKGPTSHQVSAWVKEIFGIEKAGHAGTLDPKVTGVLPVALSKATKIVNILHKGSKEYVCLMRLHKKVDEKKLRKVMKDFEGTIYQIPPVRSAVKRRLRKRKVYRIDIIEIDMPFVLFRAEVSSGTYMRTLCTDIGLALGVGAHMQELRRTKTAHITEDKCTTLQDLRDAYIFWKEDGEEKYIRNVIHPADELAEFLPKIYVKDYAVDALSHGAPLYVRGICKLSKNIKRKDIVAIYTLKNELVAIGKATMRSEEIMLADKGIAVELQRVVMPRGKYPKGWKKNE